MNYRNTFITVAPDCPVTEGVVPPVRGARKPMHVIQYELISEAPYALTQEDVLWKTHVRHKGLSESEATPEARRAFLAKPRACLRASALPKRYGWGLHFNEDGKVALYGMESEAYRRLLKPDSEDKEVLPAMRNKRG